MSQEALVWTAMLYSFTLYHMHKNLQKKTKGKNALGIEANAKTKNYT